MEYHCKYSELVAPAVLREHPRNPNTHPESQLRALEAFIRLQGWRLPVIVSKRSGFIVAGHARRIVAERMGCDAPVDYQDFNSDEQEIAFLTYDNVIPELAERDLDAYKINLADLEEYDFKLSDFEVPDESPPREEPDPVHDRDMIYALREDALFSSDNEWGIPDLDPTMLADEAPKRVWGGGELLPGDMVLYGSRALPDDLSQALLAFYVDDYRFETVWFEAVKTIERFLSAGLQAVVAPDFSVWRDDPVAIQIYNRYRAMWVARYWQAAGVRVIPSLNWSDERSIEYCCAGMPVGAPLVSVQCRTTRSRLGKEYFIRGLNRTLAKLDPEAVLVYGGEEHREWIEPLLDTAAEIFWLGNFSRSRRKNNARSNE